MFLAGFILFMTITAIIVNMIVHARRDRIVDFQACPICYQPLRRPWAHCKYCASLCHEHCITRQPDHTCPMCNLRKKEITYGGSDNIGYISRTCDHHDR